MQTAARIRRVGRDARRSDAYLEGELMEEKAEHAAIDERGIGKTTRRGFIKGAGALAGTAAMAGLFGLTGCSSAPEAASAAKGDTDGATSSPGATEADPIPPVDVPESWDASVDVVVVGTGGGGLAATAYLVQQGYEVIAVEKEGEVGGATRHAGTYVNMFGGAKEQNAMEYGYPVWPLDIHAFVRKYSATHQYSVNEKLVESLALVGGEATDWINDVIQGKQNVVLGMNNVVNAIDKAARAAGADIRLSTKCDALVSDGERVVGVLVSADDGSQQYLEGKKGVILCAGGIGMNKDLMKKYLPSAYDGTVQGGPMPSHTGEAFRMGLGVGADCAGFDSWCCWESALDETTAGGDGQFWHYFWHGERQLFHNPWLLIDVRGDRVPYYSAGIQPDYQPDPPIQMGDLSNCAAWMSRVGHRIYSICDASFAENIFKMQVTLPGPGDHSRVPLQDGDPLIENGLVTTDWLGEVEQAVERGAVKKADSLEELAEMLKLDPAVLEKAVEDWNALCEKGVDDELATPYDPSWLNPVKDPPYYAAILGGQMGKTMCGLRVDESLRVMKADGTLVDGLYANFTTAGGLTGECDYGGFWNSSLFGGVAMSWISGYAAAKFLEANEG